MLTHEQRMKLLHDQGPGQCEAGILCRSKQYPYYREAATLRDELTQVLQELEYEEKSLEKNQRTGEKDSILPKAEKDLVQKYISELEKAKNEYVYPGEKEKVCPLYPLVAFRKINDGAGAQEQPTTKTQPSGPQTEDQSFQSDQ